MMLIKDIIINISFIITFVFITSQIFKDDKISRGSRFKYKVLLGIHAGLFISILTLLSLYGDVNNVLDFRPVILMSILVYCGKLPLIISSVISLLTCLIINIINANTVGYSVIIIVNTITFIIIDNLNIKNAEKWVMLVLSSIIVMAIISVYIVKSYVLHLIYLYSVSTLLSGLIIYLLIEYVNRANEAMQKMKELSKTDYVTKLNNRNSFEIYFNSVKEKYINDKNKKLSLIILDIDYFKRVNDTYGHCAGDKVLKELAEGLVESVRNKDIVFRNGGEEFAIVLDDCSLDNAMEVAERVRAHIECKKFKVEDKIDINITVSLGVATYPETLNNIDDIIRFADMGLYKAKHNGRNRVEVIKK